MENNDWGGIGEAKTELKKDIDNLNNGIYAPSSESNFSKEENDDYRRARLRVESQDIKKQARVNYNMRQARRQREEQMKQNLKFEKKINERLGDTVSINDLKARFELNEYIKNNSNNLIILPVFKEKFAETKNKVIAGTIAGILAITTLAYGQLQYESFKAHTNADDPNYIVPTKAELDAGLTAEQIAAKREQTKKEEETINKIMNHEEVTAEQLNNITTDENIQIDPVTR